MNTKTILNAVLSLLAAASVPARQPAPVRVEHGLVQGASEGGLTVYRGIAFAPPPVRDLRWRDRRNRFTADYLDEKTDEFKEPVKVLFEQTKEEYEADYLFATDEEIRLKFQTVREIVRLLERYNLSDASEATTVDYSR